MANDKLETLWALLSAGLQEANPNKALEIGEAFGNVAKEITKQNDDLAMWKKYESFLRSVIRSGETLDEDHTFEVFKKSVQ